MNKTFNYNQLFKIYSLQIHYDIKTVVVKGVVPFIIKNK